MFIRFDLIHQRNGQTDGQTPHRSIYCAYAYASRSKNSTSVVILLLAQNIEITKFFFIKVLV